MTRFVAGAFACLLLAAPAGAQEDREGCTDHPLFSRFPNTHLSNCERTQFDRRVFPTGPVKDDQSTTPTEVEGATLWLAYELNEGATPPSGLQVMRNFETATKKAGGSVEGQYPGWCKGTYDEEGMPDMGNGCLSYGLTMKFVRAGRETWVFLQATDREGSYMLTITEREAMRQDVAVNELLQQFNADGFITIHVTFETGKASISAESATTLEQAAAVLSAASGVRVEVGGHTDNVGTPESNMALSSERARAVMAALVARGIQADRLTARGYGQGMPVADNRTEEGRAKNRRVELTKK